MKEIGSKLGLESYSLLLLFILCIGSSGVIHANENEEVPHPSFHHSAGDLSRSAGNSLCLEAPSPIPASSKNFYPVRSRGDHWESQSLYAYGILRVGDRPYQNGTIGGVGLMYFEDMFRSCGLVLFSDFNWTKQEKNKNLLTVGVGARSQISNSNAIVGLNAYFDYLNSSKADFRQASVGVEFLSCKYDLRANAYFVVGDKYSKGKREVFDNYIGDYVVTACKRERALQGYDIEIGKRCFFPCDFSIYPAIGAYYYNGGCEHAFGGMGRLAIGWKKLIELEGIGYFAAIPAGYFLEENNFLVS